MAALYGLARMRTATVGTGTITLSTAASGFLTFALAGVPDGATVRYAIRDGANSETGTGVYTSSGTTLTRTVRKSTNSDSAISLSGSAEVAITPGPEEFREILLAVRTYYVRTDGNNSNTGLADTAGGAFLTIQKAIDVVSGTLDQAGFGVTIQVRSGTYTGTVRLKPLIGGGSCTITGDTATPSNVVISTTSATAIALNSAHVTINSWKIEGVKITTTTAGYGVSLGARSVLLLGAVEFGAVGAGWNHIDVAGGAFVQLVANYTISGAAAVHWQATDGGVVQATSLTITITGTPAFSTSFAVAARSGSLLVNSNTFSGSATGTRYIVSMNATIETFAGGATYLPGNAVGSTATGGQYA